MSEIKYEIFAKENRGESPRWLNVVYYTQEDAEHHARNLVDKERWQWAKIYRKTRVFCSEYIGDHRTQRRVSFDIDVHDDVLERVIYEMRDAAYGVMRGFKGRIIQDEYGPIPEED